MKTAVKREIINTHNLKHRVRIICLLGYTLFVFSVGWAQNEREDLLQTIVAHKGDTSEVIALNKLYRLDRKASPEKAVAYLNDALILAQKLDYRKGVALTLRAYGEHYNAKGDPDKAIQVLNKSKGIYEELGDLSGINSCLNGLGNIAARQGNFNVALDYYLECARLYQELKDEKGIAIAYQNIGGIHYRQQQYDKALEYIQKSLKIKESTGDSAAMVPTLNAMSVVYTAKENYTKALEIQLRTLEISKRVRNSTETASLFNNIGIQYRYLGKPDSARYYYQQALVINKRLNEKEQLIIVYINLGDLETLTGNGEKAISYFDSSLVLSRKIGGIHYQTEAYKGLAAANKALGNSDKAYDWLEKYHDLNDSLSSEKVKQQINELQAKYESEQKDKEIAELRENEAEAQSVAERRKTLLVIAISGTLVAFLTMFFFMARRKAREKQRRAELEGKALRAQMNPHFLFNSLAAIQEMYMHGDTDLANNYLGDFGKLMRKILENSGKNSISVKEEFEMLKLYLDLEKERNSGLIEYEFSIDERIDQFGTQIPPMVIQPFVENAIWHGILPKKKKGKIQVNLVLSSTPGLLICKVEDNGVGISEPRENKGHNSKGILITEQRLGRRVKFSRLSPGTQVIIQIPI